LTVPGVPPSPPPKSRPAALTILLLLGGLLLLAPGLCAIIFIPEYVSSPNPVPDSIKQLWIISFVISAGGVALLVYAFRK
jgi:hypothetical protein